MFYEPKGKSGPDLDFQDIYRPQKKGLMILLIFGVLSRKVQKHYHRDNRNVVAKSS